jgi:hypothetical protein
MNRTGIRAIAGFTGLLLFTASAAAFADGGQAPVKLAVFDFELQDVSAAAKPVETPADAAILQKLSDKARDIIARSGRYSLVDTRGADADPVRRHDLRDCDGCEAAIAQKLGAQQALLGVVTRVEQASYAVDIRITDAASGKLLKEERAVFLGAADEWGSGVSTLLRHRVLSDDYPP